MATTVWAITDMASEAIDVRKQNAGRADPCQRVSKASPVNWLVAIDTNMLDKFGAP